MLVQLVDEFGVALQGKWNWPHYLSTDGAVFRVEEPCEPCGYVILTSLRTLVPFKHGCRQLQAGQAFTVTVSFQD